MGQDIFIVLFTAFFALFVVLAKNPLVAALSLLMTFIGIAGAYFRLGTLFLSAIQIIVYAGAIAILFVFVLMLMNIEEYKHNTPKRNFRPFWGILSVLLILGVFTMLIHDNIETFALDRLGVSQMGSIFEMLFVKYMVPFELVTVLLLASIIVAIVVSKKKKTLQEES